MRAAAEARAEQEAHEAAQKRRTQRSVRRQKRRERIIFEGVNHVKHMAAGALSACVSRSVVAPFERVKMECILNRRSNAAMAVAAEVFRSEGVRGFWRGNGLNLLRTAPYKAVNFSSYDAYRKLLQSQATTAELGRVGSFVAGAMAGITAMTMCFPLDVVRTRILAAGTAGTASPFGVMRSIVRQEGFGALYAGCLPALISVAPSGAVFYGTYDVLKERHLAIARSRGNPQKSLGTGLTLLYGGLAGVAAESAVYPLQVIQRYMQMHSATEAGKGVVTALSAQQALALAKMPGLAHPVAKAAWRFSSSARVIYTSGGLAGFYTGILPNVCQVLPNAALSYFAYEAFKQLLAAED